MGPEEFLNRMVEALGKNRVYPYFKCFYDKTYFEVLT